MATVYADIVIKEDIYTPVGWHTYTIQCPGPAISGIASDSRHPVASDIACIVI